MKTNTKKRELSYDMIKDYIKSYSLVFIIALIAISAFELYFIIRILIIASKPNSTYFHNAEHIIKFISYILLLALSVTVIVFLLANRKKEKYFKTLAVFIDVYAIVIIIWGAVIGILDVKGGDTPIVFLTVITFVAAILIVHPALFTSVVLILSSIILYSCIKYGTGTVTTSGHAINFSVFVVFAVLLNFFQTKLKLKAYISKMNIERLSYVDQLTGAYNRHSLQRHIREMSQHNLFYFGIVDIDNFKEINDTYGHDEGDACLSDVANLLKEKYGEKVYRYGGDEFAIISNLCKDDICEKFDLINNELKEKYPNKAVHLSGGFYLPNTSSETFVDYFRKADYALYDAKKHGKSKAVIYEEIKSVTDK